MASETGVLPIDPSTIIAKGRLQPGKMFVVDMEQGKIISDDELKLKICSQKPYGEWLSKHKIRLEDLDEPRVTFTHLSDASILKYHRNFWIQHRRYRNNFKTNGDRCERANWFDGDRCSISSIKQSTATFNILFQTIICASNKSANRSDKRKNGNESCKLCWQQRKFIR